MLSASENLRSIKSADDLLFPYAFHPLLPLSVGPKIFFMVNGLVQFPRKPVEILRRGGIGHQIHRDAARKDEN